MLQAESDRNAVPSIGRANWQCEFEAHRLIEASLLQPRSGGEQIKRFLHLASLRASLASAAVICRVVESAFSVCTVSSKNNRPS